MTILHDLGDIIGTILEIAILATFFYAVSGRKNIKKTVSIVLCIGYFLIVSATSMLIASQLLRMLLISISIVAFSFANKLSFFKRLVYCSIIIIQMILAEVLVGLLFSLVIDQPVIEYSKSAAYYTLGILASKLLLFIFLKPIELRVSFSEIKVPKLLVFFLLAFPLASFLIILSISDPLYIANDKIALFLIAIFIMIVANIGGFYLFESYLEQHEKQKRLLMVNQQINYQAQYFRDLAESKATANQTLHDLKNSLFAISDALETDQKEAGLLIESLCQEVTKPDAFVSTANGALDALLAVKCHRMNNSKIQFGFKSFMIQKNSVDNIDLCILLGNLLDNSIEACEKIRSEERKIHLDLAQGRDYLTIQISNTIEEKVVEKDGEIATTKSDKISHGIGLQSIRTIVKKYDGHYSIHQSENVFSVMISIKN